MKLREIIDTLNDLIRICNDGVEGFTVCVENAKIDAPELRALVLERAHACGLAAEVLAALVRELGEVPATGTTARGVLHRGWRNLRAAILHKSDRDVLDELECAEDAAMLSYQTALAKELPLSVRAIVEQQLQDILNTRAVIKKMQDRERLAHG